MALAIPSTTSVIITIPNYLLIGKSLQWNKSQLKRSLTSLNAVQTKFKLEATTPQTPDLPSTKATVAAYQVRPVYHSQTPHYNTLPDIFIEVNEHAMKPLEEYMLFTKTGAEKVNVSNSQGVRSAQCSPHFDVIHKTPSGPTNLNISQGKDKTWVEDAPQRVIYTSLYLTTQVQEDNTGNIIVIVLSVWFVAVIIGCSYELYRTNKKYKKRKEMETDASILWSKEQAAKMQEPTTTVFLQAKEGEAPQKPTHNGSAFKKGTNGVTVNGNSGTVSESQDVENPVEAAPVKSERRIGFRCSFEYFVVDVVIVICYLQRLRKMGKV